MKEELFYAGTMVLLGIGFLACVFLLITQPKPIELTYSQRRDIAITFMCTEHNNWKGAKNFCGSLPLDSDGSANKKGGE